MRTAMRPFCLLLIAISAWTAGAVPVVAQTLTINSVSATQFCPGDPISVTFTATGTWQNSNAFTLQLSDANGSFASGFQNLGSIIGTQPGTYTLVSAIPSTSYSTAYRCRITGAKPDSVSDDNGVDIQVGEIPILFHLLPISTPAVGIPYHVNIDPLGGRGNPFHDTINIDFGEGASPATLSRLWGGTPTFWKTTYATGGWKTIIARAIAPGGCWVADTVQKYAFDCTAPAIPANAMIINSSHGMTDDTLITYDTTITADTVYSADTVITFDTSVHRNVTITPATSIDGKTLWINPGISFSGGSYDTIFAEAGTNIYRGDHNIVYLNPGAAYSGNCSGECATIVIYKTGASMSGPTPSLECPDLIFDYSSAPPNSIMHINERSVVQSENSAQQITLRPNPTEGIVSVQGVSSNTMVLVMNVLGHVVQRLEMCAPLNASIDLSGLSRGTYYFRFTSDNGVTTKRIVKQ